MFSLQSRMRRTPLICLALLLAAVVAIAAGDGDGFTAEGNPLFRGADPHAELFGSRVWVYPTTHSDRFYAFSSANLTHWRRHGPVLRFDEVEWLEEDDPDGHFAWAPAALERGGRYYFYYSVGPQHETPSRIGVAVGDAPQGPFEDIGEPLLVDGNGFEAIDPMVFADPASGRHYLYAGGSDGATLRVFEMDEDLVSFRREVPVETPPRFTEGAFMHERDGVYYLSYSHGRWRHSDYSVHYATADSPTGPWEYRGPILTSDERHKGPGHHSVLHHAATDRWYIIYHRWNDRTGDGPYRGPREVAIDRLEYDAEGLIEPVRMTDEGVGPLPETDAAREGRAHPRP